LHASGAGILDPEREKIVTNEEKTRGELVAEKIAGKAFDGRRGAGGSPHLLYRQMQRAELEALLQAAFQLGMEHGFLVATKPSHVARLEILRELGIGRLPSGKAVRAEVPFCSKCMEIDMSKVMPSSEQFPKKGGSE
jgi:hypothetical protein